MSENDLVGIRHGAIPSCSSADALLNLSIKHQMLLVFGLKQVYEDMLKRKDYAAIEELKYSLAFTGMDGMSLNPEDLIGKETKGGAGKGEGGKDMLSVM